MPQARPCLVLQSDAHRHACEEVEERPGSWRVCRLCGVKASRLTLHCHTFGLEHQERMELLHCDICNVRTQSAKSMLQHLRGVRHEVSSLQSEVSRYRWSVADSSLVLA